LLDTSEYIHIAKYPYIKSNYKIFKNNRYIDYLDGCDKTYQNVFKFDYFDLYLNDSAFILFSFNYERSGRVNAKKINNQWVILDYGLGKY